MNEKKKIMIGIPHTGWLNTDVVSGLLKMRSKYPVNIQMLKSSILYISRENLVKAALKYGVDYIMFLDSDQIIEEDTIDRMAAHLEKGENIVTTLIFRKDPPFYPCVFSKQEELSNKQISLKFYDLEVQDLSKPFYVENCGMGCIMMKTEIFKKIPEPWFLPRPYTGEDIAFIYEATHNYGYKVLCDPTIQIGHVGFKNFTIQDYANRVYDNNKILNGSITGEELL